MFSSETGQTLEAERNPRLLACLRFDKWAEIVSADVEIHDESAQCFLERQTEGPLFRATANLQPVLNDVQDRDGANNVISFITELFGSMWNHQS